MTPDPYPDATAHLHDEFGLLDARLRRRLVDGTDSASPATGRDGVGTGSVTTAATDDAGVDSERSATSESTDWEATEVADRGRIDRRVAATETVDAGADRLPLVALGERFGLGRTERDALVAAVAPVVDPDYGTLYAYLQDDGRRRRPTVGLLVDLLAVTPRDRLTVRDLFARDAPLCATRLVRLDGDPGTSRVDRTVVVDDRVADFLLGTDSLPPELVDCCAVTTRDDRVEDLPIAPETATRLRQIAARALGEGAPPMIVHLSGPTGVGTEPAVAATCREAGVGRLLVCDAVGLQTGGTEDDRHQAIERLQLLLREARLRDCPLHLRRLDTLSASGDRGATERGSGGDARAGDGSGGRSADSAGGLLAAVVDTLDGAVGPVFTTGTADLPASVRTRPVRHDVVSLAVESPGYERRRALWAAVESLPTDLDPARLAATFRLTPGGIREAVALAESYAQSDADDGDADGGTLTRESIYAGCRAVTGAALGRYGRTVESVFGWDDIVLPPEPARKLRELTDRITSEGRVYDDWGFAARYARGGGIAALFTGPSGTGKTMAAEVLARESGRDLYKIDLASVVSKYVGETETRLGEIFDGAEGSDAILLFDEADALFGKRSEVSDAHDRYANVETNYLLQRIEEHDGTVLLTSNFPENIDDAFRRRIHLTVSFPRPDREAREAIWRRVFPTETPVGALDYEFLASFELTGGDVTNAALTAAFLAVNESANHATSDRNGERASSDVRVEMCHVVPAVRDELRKTGSLVDPAAFGDYRRWLTQS
jgi:hypothetical protein